MERALHPLNRNRPATPRIDLRAARLALRRHAFMLTGYVLASASVLATVLGIAMIVTRGEAQAGVPAMPASSQHALVLYALVGILALSGLLLALASHERRIALARLRVSVAQFRALSEQMNDGLVVIDKEGVITAASERFARMLGCAANELIGTSAAAIELHVDAHALAPGQACTIEGDLRRASGEALAARVVARALAPVSGAPSGVLAVVTDLTEQRKVELAHRLAEDRARQHLNQLAHVARVSSMGEMASAIAHEINQPLTAIASYAKACMRLLNATPAPQRDVVDAMAKIADDALRAGQVVRHIRAFLQAKEADMMPLDANRLVTEVIRLAQPEARQLGATLRTELGNPLPPIMGEPIQLEQVILNLVRNALEAMHDAGVRRRVVTLRTASTDEGVAICVHDTGPGIDAATADQLFEPFFTTKADGLGIGLAISRSIVTMHEGSLLASNDPAAGAVFTIRLPRTHLDAERPN